MNRYQYQTFDETNIPLSSTATMWMNTVEEQQQNQQSKSTKKLLNSNSVVQIILRRAPAPNIEGRMHKFTSKRLAPTNKNIIPAKYDRQSKRIFSNFLSPTQAAKSREWKKAHAKTYLRPMQQQSSKNKKGKKKKLRKQKNRSREQELEDEIIALKAELFNAKNSNSLILPKMQKHRKINSEQFIQSTLSPEPITSGTFYKSRRSIMQTLENNEKLEKLKNRRIRMEKKLHETLKAWTHMHEAIGEAVNVLKSSRPTKKESERVYPRLLQSMERNRKRLQRQLEKMTEALEIAANEETDFLNQVNNANRNEKNIDLHPIMKPRKTRTLL
jgi:hypothetical protein